MRLITKLKNWWRVKRAERDMRAGRFIDHDEFMKVFRENDPEFERMTDIYICVKCGYMFLDTADEPCSCRDGVREIRPWPLDDTEVDPN